MKKKYIAIFALCTMILFTFVGCNNLPAASGTASSGMNLNSTVSGVLSKVESDTKNLGSQVSGVVSGVASSVQSK